MALGNQNRWGILNFTSGKSPYWGRLTNTPQGVTQYFLPVYFIFFFAFSSTEYIIASSIWRNEIIPHEMQSWRVNKSTEFPGDFVLIWWDFKEFFCICLFTNSAVYFLPKSFVFLWPSVCLKVKWKSVEIEFPPPLSDTMWRYDWGLRFEKFSTFWLWKWDPSVSTNILSA